MSAAKRWSWWSTVSSSRRPAENHQVSNSNREATITVAVIVLFVFVVVRNAWVCDDAYITFRTVDNLVHGYGLTWNTAERVQVYTHPLWMFLLSLPYFFTAEIYYTSLILSILVSLAAVSLLALGIARSFGSALLAITILTFSKAFVDYSTSGLENPLTHLAVALFLFVYLNSSLKVGRVSRRTIFLLSLIAALATVNRMDTFLIFLPMLLYSLVVLRFKGLYAVALGFLPFVLWECFSLFYYGFPFPNTAYAKLNTGVNVLMLAKQGLQYLLDSLHWDPLTLLAIIAGVLATLLARERRYLPVGAGIVLYLLYIIRIGGDFMTGRLLTAPLFAAVALLSYACFPFLKVRWLLAMGTAVILIGLSTPYSPLASDADYGLNQTTWTKAIDGIVDERAFYYQGTGLLRGYGEDRWPNHRWGNSGRRARMAGQAVVVTGTIGLFGFYAGPRVHVVDSLAIADPLLARLPVMDTSHWRIGHFERRIPDGYIDTLVSGQNRISDRDLAAYYDKLSLITRGNLFDLHRLPEIWNMNVGRYNNLLDPTGLTPHRWSRR